MPPRKRLPPFVQRARSKFRGWAVVNGRRAFGPSRDTPLEAHYDALRMRDASERLVDGISLRAAMDLVLDETRAKRTAGTVRWYRDHFAALLEALGDGWLADLTADRVEAFVRERLRSVSASTVNADLRALHRVFAVAMRRGLAIENPVRQVDRPRADRPPIDYFDADELASILARVDDAMARDLFVAMASTGVRRSELARIRPEHLRVGAVKQVVVPGKRANRVLPLSPEAAAAFQQLELPVDLRTIDATFRRWRGRLGDRRLHPHALRHTFATALVREGVRPDVVMRLLGHRSISTTLLYWHEHGEEAAAAVARLRLVPPDEPRRAAQD